MDQEIRSIEKNDTWDLVNLPPCVKKIGVKWIYKTKTCVQRALTRIWDKIQLSVFSYGKMRNY